MMRKTSPPESETPETIARTAVRSALAPRPEPSGRKNIKSPIRTCVACREESPKRDLVRIVRTTAGEVEIDATSRKNGRGAYLHPRLACLKLAVKRRALDRALGGTPSPENLTALEAELTAREAES